MIFHMLTGDIDCGRGLVISLHASILCLETSTKNIKWQIKSSNSNGEMLRNTEYWLFTNFLSFI